jgi:hypothetical protein
MPRDLHPKVNETMDHWVVRLEENHKKGSKVHHLNE